MSMLSSAFKKLGKGAKKLVTNPGKWAENVGRSVGNTAKTIAPALSIIPGVGPLAAAGIGALGSVAGGHNMKSTLGTGLKTYALGSALNMVPGASTVGAKLGSGLSKVPGVNSLAGFAKAIPGSGAFLPSSSTQMAGAELAAPDPSKLMRLTPNGTNAAQVADLATAGGNAAGAAGASGFGGAVKGALGGVLKSAKENPLVVGQIASGVLQARQQGAQNDLQREQFDYQKSQTDDEQKRRQANASLLAPLFQSYLSRAQTAKSPWQDYTPYNPYRTARAS